VKTERWWTGIAGLVFVGLIVPAIVTEILGPDPTSSPAKVFAKFHSERTDVLISSVLLMAALLALLMFMIGVIEVARGPDGHPLLVGLARSAGGLGVALVVAYTAIFAVVAATISEFHSPEVVYGLFRSANAIDSSSDLFIGVFVAAIAVPLAKAGVRGRWFKRYGVFTGVVYAIGSLTFTSKSGGVFGAFEVIGTLLVIVWSLVTSIGLLRATGEPTRVQPSAS
jgi:hypothetical protein